MKRNELKDIAKILDLKRLTFDQTFDLFGLNPNQINYLIYDQEYGAKRNGLFDSRKYKAEQKMLIALFYWRHKLSFRAMSTLFNISTGTISGHWFI